MFGKRKSFSYQYDQAVEIIDENRLNALIEKGVITQNGSLVEIDDRFLSFFEEIMEVNEDINIAYINENPVIINPVEGSYTFIADYETFHIPPEVTVVGIENSENFHYLSQQAHLFPGPNTLFVSRYPQSGDLIN